ncbi:leukotoxin LktA family filamentous adhesin [Undibacter mobilis]|nr:leukotoxin LktA family filamentous adhesin [Undibacter mobilis]
MPIRTQDAAARPDWRARVDRLATQVICTGLALMMAIWPVRAQQANVIVTDGRTQTQVQTSGNVTNITTSTVSGANGFNSFSQFGVGLGNTVNLHLPTGTQNLINIVRDAPAYVNGTLNAYKNGQIGGNVYFADPYGFVVGRTGVVNVGSLNVSTPTREFVDGMISPSGQINEGAVSNLLAGTIPISPDGNIRIKGRVNAVDAVRLTGQNVFVGSGRDAVNREQATRFASTVNSRGLRSANNIVVRNGSIQIVAANDARVNGGVKARNGGAIGIDAGRNAEFGSRARVSADSKNGNGGTIAVKAGHDIVVSGYGVLSAKSTAGNAGSVRLLAQNKLVVEAGARFDASAAQGNAGLVELSSFGTFDLQNGFKVDVSAPNGQAGALLMDPPNVVVGASGDAGVTMDNEDIAAAISSLSVGATYIIPAQNFTVTANGVIKTNGHNFQVLAADGGAIVIDGLIDTRSYSGASATNFLADLGRFSTGNSGSVLLSGTNITLGATGKIFADVNNTTGQGATNYTGGAVTLAASVRDHQGTAESNANSQILIAGKIGGSSITATANADASTSYTNSVLAMAQFGAGVTFGLLTGFNGAYVKSQATAKVIVEGTATLKATGAVTLASLGSVVAENPAITFSLTALQNAVAAGVVVGVVNADVETHVKSGATISSGDLRVLAGTSAELSVAALVFTETSAADVVVAYSTGTMNTKALIDSGANIQKVGNVSVVAQSQNSFSTTATALSGGTGSAAVAVAISDVTSNTVANMGAGIAQNAGAGSVTVYAGSDTTKNSVSAASTVGTPYLLRNIITKVAGAQGFTQLFGAGGLLEGTRLFSVTQSQGTTAAFRAGLTLALNMPTLTSSASIANVAPDNDGDMVASGAAPNIYASGNVGVVSMLSNAALRTNAATSIESNPAGTPAHPSTQKGVSMAVALTQADQSSNAYIGSSATITGAHIGVSAETDTPITNTWLNFASYNSVTQTLSDLISHANGNLGIVNNILTSYANATAEATSFGFSGSLNYFDLTTSTTAWIGSGATITRTGSGCGAATICWSSLPTVSTPTPPGALTLPAAFNLADLGARTQINWGNDVVVKATTSTESIHMGGNFSWFTFFGTNGGPDTPDVATAIGGSANVAQFHTSTVAGIGAGAVVNTNSGSLSVTADTSDLVYAVAPTSGKGGGLGLNGIATVLLIDNNTSASISNSARVTSSSVNVAAQQEISTFNVGGAVGITSGSGIGLVVALASISTNTSAYIGDNSQALTGTAGGDNDAHVAPSVAGYIDAFETNVTALSVGRLTTVAVAATANNNTPTPGAPPAEEAVNPGATGFLSSAVNYFGGIAGAVAAKIAGIYDKLDQQVSGPVNGGTSAAGAGSAAIDLTSVATAASIADATVKYTPGGNNRVSVQALNNTIIDTASGGAAMAKGAPGTESTVGIAGAVAVTLSNDLTTATISRSTVTAYSTTVQALAGGENTTIGLGIAVTGGSGGQTQVAVSVSAADLNNGVQASVDSSTIGQANGGFKGDLTIIASQNTNIGIGGGSLYGGLGTDESNGLGVSLTYAGIGDPTSGAAVSAILSNSKVSNTDDLIILAMSNSRIIAGAATAGGGPNANGFAGSVVVTEISPTILAEITSVPAVAGTAAVTGGITVAGDVRVNAFSGSDATLNTLIRNAAITANGGLSYSGDSDINFDASDLSPSSATGAAIIAVAGNVQGGKSNVGISIVVNRIASSYEAYIDRTTVTSTGGVVDVSARDNSEIIGIAIGVGVATGSVAGNGSVAYNAINNFVVAQIGHGVVTSGDPLNTATATVSAAAVSVTATAGGKVRSAAGAISVNLSGGNAVGLSAGVSQIGTYVSAAIAGASVTATGALSNSSPLIGGNLRAGNVLVSGASTADIITVSIGAAITTGNDSGGPPTPPPSSGLSTLLTRLAPMSTRTLPGMAGPPPAPPPAQSPPSDGMSGAGSLAISTQSGKVYASIVLGGANVGSNVTALGNVLVLADNDNAIAAYAGAVSAALSAGKGLGASVVVNTINGETGALINGSAVDGRGLFSTAMIDNGVLANTIDPSDVVTPASTLNLNNGTQTLKGIAVVATSAQKAQTVSALLSASSNGLAIAANAVTNVMGGRTSAEVLASDLNTHLQSGDVSAVQVTASSASFANNLVLGISDSGGSAAGTAALNINTMNRTTVARVFGTDIGSSTVAAGAVGIKANAFQSASSNVLGAAGSGGSAAISGSSLANIFQSTTQAIFEQGTVRAGAMSVTAAGLNGFFGAVGAGSVGSSVGLGATVLVAMSDNTVQAVVGDDDPTTTATSLHLSGALTVAASNTTRNSGYVMVAALGGSGGIAAQFSGMFIDNNVFAALRNASVTMSGTGGDGAVSVLATETDSIAPIVGGLAGGGSVGFGAAVNLVSFKSNTRALMAGATVTTAGAVSVNALSVREINPITVAGSLAGTGAFAGTVGIVLVDSGASTDQMSVLNAGSSSGNSSSGTLGNARAATGVDVIAGIGGNAEGVAAQVLNSSVTAGAIGINATSEMATRNITGSLALGGTGGIGAGVAYTTVTQKITAEAIGGQLTSNAISIGAVAGDHGGDKAVQTFAAAGAGGLYVGLGAAVGESHIDNTVRATLGATTTGATGGLTSGTVAVTASDSSSITSYGYGGAGGLAAVGLSLANAEKSSDVTAEIAASTQVTNVANVAVMTTGGGSVSAETIAGAAGVLAGAGASATATDSQKIIAQIGNNARVQAAGTGILVYASGTPDVSAVSKGVAVGGVGIGVSSTIATAGLEVTASIGNSTNFSGSNALTVSAVGAIGDSGHSAYSQAVAAGGGTLYGLQGTNAQANNTTKVHAYGGTGVRLPSANVSIAAQNDTDQYAEASGVAFGYVAAGATFSEATSTSETKAWLDTGVIATDVNNNGSLSIVATGTDTTVAKSTAGSGGLSAGAAAVSKTTTTSTVSAELLGGATLTTLYVTGLGVRATHRTNYAATGDAVQASAIGASGGSADNTVTSTVTAKVGGNLIVNSYGRDRITGLARDINVIALDEVRQTSGGARAGSGGGLAVGASLSKTTVTQTINTLVGAGTILSLNDNPLTTLGKINIEGFADLQTTDTVTLTAAGLFAGGGAETRMTATATITVDIDAARLFSAGNIAIGSAAKMIANNNANASLYGLVGGVGASSHADLTATQNVSIGGTRVEAWGLINMYAGKAGDGSRFSQIQANATTVVYNNTLIAITAEHGGYGRAYGYATLTIDPGSLVLGANNVFIGATQGGVEANGRGTLYSPFLELFSTEDHDNNSDSNGSHSDNPAQNVGRGDVIVNGKVMAGVHNQANITIGLNGAVNLDTSSTPCALLSAGQSCAVTLQQVSDPTQFSSIVSYNNQKIYWSLTGGFSPYQDVLQKIATLSGLTTAQVDAALTAKQTIAAINDDTEQNKQRQIDTLTQQAPFASRGSNQVYSFSDILVSAGSVSVLAEKLTGTGQIASQGTAAIDIDNQGLKFLSLNKLTISGVTGGRNVFTGRANDQNSTTLTYRNDASGTAPLIKVDASYYRKDANTGQSIDDQGHLLVTTPDIYFGGVVTNTNGLLSIENKLGSVVATQSFVALAIEMKVPEGAFTFDGSAGTVYNMNGDVASQWNGKQYRPTDTLSAVELAATWLGTYGSIYVGGVDWAHPYNYYSSNTNGVQGAPVTNYGTSASTVFTARMLSLGYAGGELWSAIFLPMNGIPSAAALATGEGTTVDKIVLAPWERHNYEDQAYGDGGRGGPFHCSGCGNYFQVVKIAGAAVQPVTAESANVARGELTIGKAIIITAGVININGKVTVGQTSNYSANIGQSAQDAINALKSDADALATAKRAAAAGNYYDISGYVTSTGSDVRIGARYDALNDQILLNGVVQGTGGYVYLNGKIISTSTSGLAQGEIVVNGGAGTVNVVNSTGVTLVTNTINTGVTAASVVQLVDRLKNETTWYVYNAGAAAGQQVTTYWAAGTSTSSYQSQGVQNQGQSGPTGLVYRTKENMYYQWVDTATLTRPQTSQSNDYGWTFVGANANSEVYPWVRGAPTLVENAQQIVNGQAAGNQWTNFQQVVSATGDAYNNSFSTGDKCCGTDFSGTWHQLIYYRLTLNLTNTVKASFPISVSFNGGGVSSVNVASNSSIVLNGPINNLQGTTTITATGANSSITVAPGALNPLVSGTQVTLNGQGGIGSADRPVPVQVYGGALTAVSTDRDIAVASQGSLKIAQVRVDSARTNATTGKPEPQGDVYITASGDINSASPYNVNSPVIIGKSITIDSTSGAIGAITTVDAQGHGTLGSINPLVIQTWATTLPGGTTDGGVLNSASNSGAYLIQSSGDLRIGAVSATDGPVFVAAMNGSILSGHNNVGLTAQQQQYLESVWASLDLVNGSGAAQVASFESLVNAAYRDYWQLRNLAFNVPGHPDQYNITDLGVKSIGAQMLASGALAAGTDLNSAEARTAIQTEVSKRYMRAQYLLGMVNANQLGTGVTLETLFNIDAASAARLRQAPGVSSTALDAYDATYRYALSTTSDVYAAITDRSQWSLDQLRYTVSSGATSANPPSIASLPLNVKGRQVMLFAPNGSIGSLAAPEQFSFTSVDASNLTAAQKGLLASAGPGQLTVTPVVDAHTGITTYFVSVQQQKLIIVDPLGPVAAKAKNDIYLGSASDMVLGGVPLASFGPLVAAQTQGVQTTAAGGGGVRLVAVGSITGVSGAVAVSGNIASLTLIAETGSIGRATVAGQDPADNPDALLLALTGTNGGRIDQASAKQGIFIRQKTGDLVLGQINADQGSAPIELAASGSIYGLPSFTDFTIARIFGSTLDVRAGSHIGYNGTTLQPLLVRIGGAITGSSVGDMAIYSPASNMTLGASGSYGTLTAGGRATFNTIAGSITVNADVTAGNALQFLANAGVTFAAGTAQDHIVAKSTAGAILITAASLNMGAFAVLDAAGVLTVVTTGDATLGQLISRASYAAAGNAASIVVQAGGITTAAILSNGDGLTDLLTTGTGARVSLNASNIGTASQRVTVSSQGLAATATTGSIYLNAAPDMRATLLSAVKGSVDVTGAGSYALDSVLASTDAGATGHFIAQTTGPGTLTVGTATGRGTLRLLAADNVSFGSLTSLALAGDPGDVIVTTGEGAIQGGSITAAGGVTLTAGANLPVNSPLAANAKITSTGTIASSTLISLHARGDIDWETLNAATTIDLTSTDGGARVGTATTVGSITMQGKQDVAFEQLTNTAAPGQGDVTLTSTSGSIVGGSITSNGSVSLIAEGSITATGAAGDGGELNWSVLRAGGSMFVRSLGAAVTVDVVESGGSMTLWAKHDVTFRQVKTTGANSDITLRSDEGAIIALGTGLVNVDASGSVTMSAATTITGADVRAGGSVAMTAANGQIRWNAVTAGTTVDVRSSANVIDIATITSGGAQTLWAKNDVTFTQLIATAGGADITSDTGKIAGGAVTLGGATRMAAKTTISGTTATSSAGAMEMIAEEMITWNSVEATGGRLTITSTRETIDIPSLTSGGKMTIDVAQDMAITQIATTGIQGDAGDVEVTSRTGRITGGTIAANGGVTLNAPVSITGVSITGATGAVAMNTAGLIDWTTVTAGTTVGVRSTADNINFGSVTSGGTQTIRAYQNVVFNALTTTGIPGDLGDIIVTAEHGSISAGTVTANGDASFAGGQSINVSTMQAGSATLSGPQNLTVGMLRVYRAMSLGADVIDVTAVQLPSLPPVPLHVKATGYQGGVATRANLNIDPPQVVIDQYRIVDSILIVDSPALTIASGYVPGQMLLMTPAGQILLNNRGPGPVGGNNLQLYQPGGAFTMQQNGNANFSNTQVVYYDSTISSTIINYGGGNFTGSSFVRNAIQDMRNGDDGAAEDLQRTLLIAFYLQSFGEGWRGLGPIQVLGDGPAVNVEGLLGPGENRKSRKGYRTNLRSSAVENRAAVSFAAADYGR